MTKPGLAQREAAPNGRLVVLASSLVLVLSIVFLAWCTPLTAGRMLHRSAELFPRFPFWSWLQSHRPAFLDEPATVGLLLLAACGGGFAACALTIRIAWNAGPRRDLTAIVLGTSALCMAITWLAPPNVNSNLWNYFLRARIAAAHGHNPYTTAADEFPDDPLYRYANHAYTGTPGGKLAAWKLFAIPLARLGGDDPVQTLLVFRTGLLFVSLGTLALLRVATRRILANRAVAGLAFWALNPVVIMNALARVDTLMMFYLALAVVLLSLGRKRWAAVALTLSVYVKLVTAPLLAVAALAEIRARRWRELLLGGVVIAATTVVVWGPFYDQNARELIVGYTRVAKAAEGSVGGATKTLAAGGFALLIAAMGLTRRDGIANLIAGWLPVQFYFSLFFAKFASADYLLGFLLLVAVSMNVAWLLLAFGIAAAYFLFDEWYFVGDVNVFPMPDLFPFPRAVVFSLPLAAAALALLVRFVRRRRSDSALS
jgi:hypothetical protein